MKEENRRNRRKMPLVRTEELVVQNVGDEVLIYDLRTDKAHNLNSTLSIFWNHCDGKTEVSEVLQILRRKTKGRLDQDFISIGLKELSDSNLLDDNNENSAQASLSRRELIQRYGTSALALPVLISLVAPVSAQMGSCIPAGGLDCHLPPFCCPGNTCTAISNPDGTVGNVCIAVP